MIKKYLLEGLDCANCAAKIETNINARAENGSVSVIFATKTLKLDAPGENELNDLYLISEKVVKEIEPDVEIKEKARYENICDNCQIDDEKEAKSEVWQIAAGIVLAAAGFISQKLGLATYIYISVYVLAYLASSTAIILRAAKNIARGKVFDENFLMSLASLGAMLIGEFTEGIAVMILYRIGEVLQSKAVEHSRKSISALMDIRPDFANLKRGDEIIKVHPGDVEIGDIIVVKAGEKIPLDGTAVAGGGMLDTSALTGESVPVSVQIGQAVLSGCVNLNGVLEIEVEKSYENSTVSRIIEMAENAAEKKAKTEDFISRFAKIYTPIVTLLAVAITLIPPIFVGDFKEWLYRGLIFLVMSCPCALVISVPLTFFGGIGGASKEGVLVKGGNCFDGLAGARTVVFDKTGTLTEGKFSVTAINPEGVTKEELLKLCAQIESLSNHPVALSIAEAYGEKADNSTIEAYEEIAGKGISAVVGGKKVFVGNESLMKEENIEFTADKSGDTVIYVAADGKYIGCVLVNDKIREDAPAAVEELKKIGVKKVIMLSGDKAEVCERVGNKLKIDEVYGGLLPADKVEKLEEILSSKTGSVLFAGDGINDAPALALADVGIAMGGVGSQAASEAADVVLMTDRPSSIVTAVKIARKTLLVAKENIVFALVVKSAVLLLGIVGAANMWEAVFADVGVCFIVILNSLRMLKK
ncbi:MAG: heavy metal translocating P-type ATPase [Bacillota bacterium]|nr:heavy metal translocating P-type ATPase [Bacillota bacterium]